MDVVDHLVFSCSDLDSGIEYVSDHLGVTPVPGGRHPNWGTHNALLSLGDSTYFEIIAPDPQASDTVQPPEVFTGIGSGSLSTWAASLDDLPGRHERARQAGHAFGEILEGTRLTKSGVHLEWSLTNPVTRLKDGVVPFLIDWGRSPHPARVSSQGCILRRFSLLHPDPESVRAILSKIGVRLSETLEVIHDVAPGLLAVIQTPRGDVEIRS